MKDINITLSDEVIAVSNLQVGVTITQVAPDKTTFGTEQARQNVNQAIRDLPDCIYNVHPFGFGITNNVMNAQGVYNWRDLDRRMAWLKAQGVTNMMFTFWSAPDHMLIQGVHPTYKMINPEYEDAFADLVLETIARYRFDYPVQYIQIWNEMKGYGRYYGDWDITSYTRMYNKVYEKIRFEFPDLKIAGPYLILDYNNLHVNYQTLSDWYNYAQGANAVSTVYALTHIKQDWTLQKYLEMTENFRLIPERIRGLCKGLEYWSAENYIVSNLQLYEPFSIEYQACWSACMLRQELLGGVSISLAWGLQGDATLPYQGIQRSWCHDTRDVNNAGQATLIYDVYDLFHRYFGPGTEIVNSISTDEGIITLASKEFILVINTYDEPVSVFVNHNWGHLDNYEVRLFGR